MSDNNNCADLIPTEDFPDFILDPLMSHQIYSIFMRRYFNGIGLRFTRQDMRNEFVRYISFYLFPNSLVHIREFIRAGFYYSSYQDVVICYLCGFRRGNWQVADNPNDIHRQLSPTCILFRQQSIVNIQYLWEYIRQNPTGPNYLPASSMTTEFRMLPPADLPGQPNIRPLEDIHNGTFDVRGPALIQVPMIETENRDQCQVHGELINPLCELSNPLSSEGCPALTYRNHSTNSETNFEQRYENSHSTGGYSDSSQDTTELKTVFRQEIQSSEVVERNTNVSEYQKLIKRTSHASSRLSVDGFQNGDVIPTEINRNAFGQEQEEVTEERTVPKAETERLNGRQEMQSNKEIETNLERENSQRTENNTVTPADLESYQVQEVTDEGMTPLPEAELHKESQEGDSKQETTQEREADQDIDKNQKTYINQNISLTKEILVSSLENEGRSVTNVSSTVDIGLETENNETVPVHTLQVTRTELREQPKKLQNSEVRIDETDFDQVEEVTEERKVPVAKAELHNEKQKILTNQEPHLEIQNRQRTENNQVTPADLETSEDSITTRSTEFSISRRHTKYSVYRSRSNSRNSRNIAQSSEQSVQQSGSSFTDECDIVELGLEKENNKVVQAHTLQANSSGLTKQPQKSEERIDETERQVVSEVGNTRTILDDRKSSRTIRSLPNKHTNASTPPLNQSRNCKSLENNGKQADIKSKSRNLNQNDTQSAYNVEMRSMQGATGQFEENGNVEEETNNGRRSGKHFKTTVKDEGVMQAGQEKKVLQEEDTACLMENFNQSIVQEDDDLEEMQKFISEIQKNLMKKKGCERRKHMKVLLDMSKI